MLPYKDVCDHAIIRYSDSLFINISCFGKTTDLIMYFAIIVFLSLSFLYTSVEVLQIY